MSSQSIKFPPKNYNIMIPFDKTARKFLRGVCSSTKTEGKISSEEVDDLLELLETTCESSDIFDLAFHHLLVPIIATIFIFINAGEFRFRLADLKPAGFLVLILFYFVMPILYIIFKLKSSGTRIKRQAQTVIDLYQANFLQNGFKWVIPDNFPEWIQITRTLEEERQGLLQECQ